MRKFEKMQVNICKKFIFAIVGQEIGEMHKSSYATLNHSMHKCGKMKENLRQIS